jgi:peroxiredoxin
MLCIYTIQSMCLTSMSEAKASAPSQQQQEQKSVYSMYSNSALKAGTLAPDFDLRTTPDQTVSLREFRGRPIILAFYPADFSPVCGDQMTLYNEILPEFQQFNAELLGISVDGVWCHLAFSKDRNLHFPLLSDFEPKGKVANEYGAYRKQDGVTERALFVIDENGIIRWSYVSPIGVNPGAEGILKALESISKPTEQNVDAKKGKDIWK